MKPTLQLKLGQQLTMTPQLQQAIRLLQLPVLELNNELQQALEENVMLEAEELPEVAPDASEPGGETEPEVVAGEAQDTGTWDSAAGSDNWHGDDRRPEIPDQSGETLRDHLLWQLEMEHFTPREVVIGHAIVDYINEDGYLTEDLEGIARTLNTDASFGIGEIETTLAKVQALDPAGVGARSPAECIELQLRQLSDDEPCRDLAIAIAHDSLDLVAEQQYGMLQRRHGVSDEELDIALALVRSCHPRPGSAIQPPTTEYVVPDVYVRKQDDKWVVEVNRSAAPQLRVNQTYAEMLRGNGGNDTLRGQLQEARWLVRSLEIRNETLLKVAMCIVERQAGFLEHGEESMKPMILKDIAEAIEMHESTVSRVTANKYMHTPRGVVEFRHFFSSQLTGRDGEEQSSTAIRAKIKKLVGQENPAKPLSDSKIAKILEQEGVKVARRTVAKYREALKIPPSSERRRRPVR